MRSLYDDDMQKIRETLSTPVPCRGRKGLLDTDAMASYTQDQLNEIQPLTELDDDLLRTQAEPPANVKLKIALRIAAARFLKYGR